MKLSTNFTLDEFIKSETAIRQGLDNTPSKEVIDNLINLVTNVLQPLRTLVGLISITSGYRSPEVNASVGGSKTSDHCFGMAADIEMFGIDNKNLAVYIKDKYKYTQLILEYYEDGKPSSGWVHVSYNPLDLKCECLRAIKQNGKTVYLKGF